MSEVRVNNLSNENSTGGPTISGITTYSGSHFFVPPQGDTASRPSSCPIGSLRFNTDSAHLEYYRGDTIGWTEIEAELTAPLGGGGGETGSNSGLGVRALMAGGDTPSYLSHIDFITMSSMGDAADFGNLSTARAGGACISNRTTIAFAGGYNPGISNSIDTTQFATTGNAVDTANLSFNANGPMGGSGNSYRGIVAGGRNPSGTSQNIIQYYTFAAGVDTEDFGDLLNACFTGSACASSTRSVISAGVIGPSRADNLDFITTATTGNSQDFGNLSIQRNGTGAFSNATRGVWGGGETPNKTNIIDYITIATTGNAIDFGDMSYTRANASNDGASSSTRGIFSGGGSPATDNDNSRMRSIEKVEIATLGNTVDFGDMTDHASNHHVMSNAHGGL